MPDDEIQTPSGRKVKRPRTKKQKPTPGTAPAQPTTTAADYPDEYSIDRFEDAKAVLTDGAGRETVIDRAQLPPGAQPGDILGPGLKALPEATAQLRRDTAAAQTALAGDTGEDIAIQSPEIPWQKIRPERQYTRPAVDTPFDALPGLGPEYRLTHPHRPQETEAKYYPGRPFVSTPSVDSPRIPEKGTPPAQSALPILQIDPNTAPYAVIESLPHVGPAVASRWIDEREKQPFRSLADLKARVRGIGPNLWSRISPYLREPTGVPGPQTSLDFDNKLKPFTAEDLERLPPDLPLTDPQAAAKKNQAAQEAHDPMTLDKVLDLPVLHAIRRLLEHIGKHAVPPLHESSTAQPSSQLLALAARLDSLTEQLQLQAGDSSHLTTDINNRTQQNMGQI